MKKLLVRLFISLAIGGAMLYLATRETTYSGVWTVLREARWSVLLPYFGIMAVQHIFRVWRWGFLLAPIHPVPFSRLLPISSVGFFAILTLPLRMGEVVRPYLVADPPRLRMSQGLGTMAVERVFDGLVLSLAAFGTVALASRTREVPQWVWAAGITALVLFVVALIVLVMTLWQRDRAVTLCRRMFGIASERLADRAASIAGGIVEGFKVLPDLRRLLPFVGATLAYWFGNAAAIWILGKGFDMQLTLGGSVAVMALVGIGIMIPAGPGFIGNFELFADAAVKLYAPLTAEKKGGAFIIATHATNAAWYFVTGLVAMMSPQVTFRKVWTLSTQKQSGGDSPAGQKLDTAVAPAHDGRETSPEGHDVDELQKPPR